MTDRVKALAAKVLAGLRSIPEPVRAWIYRVAAATGALAVARGWVEPDEFAVWLPIVAAVLAVANTSTG